MFQTLSSNHSLYFNQHWSFLGQDLKDYFRQAGEVTYADAHKLRRNEGCIEFASRDDMRRALDKLDGTEINGRKIKLIEAGIPSMRGKSFSRSRSRSPRMSTSRYEKWDLSS